MYCAGLRLSVLGHFENHQGIDSIVLCSEDMAYHFEFTYCRHHVVVPSTTVEDLVVFYEPDREKWTKMWEHVSEAGFKQVTSLNPYWEMDGRTFEDNDGYRFVLQNDRWSNRVVHY